MNLTVIAGTQSAKPDYKSLYMKAFLDCADSFKNKGCEFHDLDLIEIKKMVLFGVKSINYYSKKQTTPDARSSYYLLICSIRQMIRHLTPLEFENIFPITKRYDGVRCGSKDYYFTKDYIKSIGEQKKIGDSIGEFLWNYQNIEVTLFTVNFMSASDAVRKDLGEKTAFEELCEENGITMYQMVKDEKGKDYLMNNDTGEITRFKKKLPRYLKVVKGKTSST